MIFDLSHRSQKPLLIWSWQFVFVCHNYLLNTPLLSKKINFSQMPQYICVWRPKRAKIHNIGPSSISWKHQHDMSSQQRDDSSDDSSLRFRYFSYQTASLSGKQMLIRWNVGQMKHCLKWYVTSLLLRNDLRRTQQCYFY